jgi:hypothetical protein
MPVQRADSDLGATGDVLEGSLGAPLRERRAGGGEQELAIALGVGALGAAALGGGQFDAADLLGVGRFRRASHPKPPK